MQLHRVAVPGEHEAHGSQLSLEHVADRIEGRMVRSGHDELREGRRCEDVQWDLGLPGGPRSTKSALAPCSSSGVRGEGGTNGEPTASRNLRRKPPGSSARPLE